MLTRRDFLVSVGAMAGAAVCSRNSGLPGGSTASASAAMRRRLDRIGIQLYSVRTEMQRDFEGTIARIAEIGYNEVEFAGYFGRTPEQVRELLARNKLASPSTHIGYDVANWDKTLDVASAAGHQYVTIAYIDEPRRRTVDDWRRIAADFNRLGERARARGLRFAYHNHDFELRAIDGTVPLDLLLAETDPANVSYEMDVYWVTFGGGDPKAYIRKYPDRFAMLHIKDSAGPPKHEQMDVGKGIIDFGSILRLDAEQKHSVKHVFVEHDQPPDPMSFARNSFAYLKKLEY